MFIAITCCHQHVIKKEFQVMSHFVKRLQDDCDSVGRRTVHWINQISDYFIPETVTR